MWVLTGKRECCCGIHISSKSIRIVDDAPIQRRIEHLFDTSEACLHLTNFCIALNGTAMRYTAERCNLADSIAELWEMAAGRDDVLARPPASRPSRGTHGTPTATHAAESGTRSGVQKRPSGATHPRDHPGTQPGKPIPGRGRAHK